MKSKTSAALILVAAGIAGLGCGGEAKPAQSAAKAEQAGSESADAASSTQGLGTPEQFASASSAAPPGADEATKVPAPCGGFDIPDLLSVISQAACEAPDMKPGSQQRPLKDVLEIKVTADSPIVAPGSSAQLTITYKNKGKTDLSLYFVVDPEPRFDFEVFALKKDKPGARVDKPATPAPPLPADLAKAPPPEQRVARVTLPQLGTAKLMLKWNAVKYKWASKERAKGALPGHGYPREPAGPLAKGKYIVRIVTPITGVSEGAEHEVSQPQTQIVVGGI
jgi:hypothetical protein